MRKFTILALALLIGCSESKDGSEIAGDGTLILFCSGELSDGMASERKNVSYLIKVKDDGYQDSLLYYSDAEKRFDPSRCSRTTLDCLALSTPDQIIEQGTIRGSDNSVISSETTTINRRTGAMRTVKKVNHLSDVVFEGICVKSESPVEVSQKF